MPPFSHSSSSESSRHESDQPSATPAEAVPPLAGSLDTEVRVHGSSVSFSETFLNSSSARDALPEQYRTQFDELRSGIFAFCHEFEIPVETLKSKEDFGKQLASKRIPPARMADAVLLFQRLEYLVTNKEPLKEEHPEYLEEAEHLYHLSEQYNAQVSLLQRCGILHTKQEQLPTGRLQRLFDLFQSLLAFGKKKRPEIKGTEESFYITGTNGQEYPIPTLEQIAERLYEQREKLETKRDQGFTKLLLVPFGMSLDALREILKQFLLSYKQTHPTFDLDTNDPLYTWEEGYKGADIGNSPKMFYYPKFFDPDHHEGQTKTQVLEEQGVTPSSFPGWKVHLFQPSDPTNQESKGFALIPREGQGTTHGEETPRPSLEAGKSPNDYLSILQKAQEDPYSPYYNESGLTPEDWILAFITHLEETGQPLDDYRSDKESITYLTGAFFLSINSSAFVPCAYWFRGNQRASLYGYVPRDRDGSVGVRSSVIVQNLDT